MTTHTLLTRIYRVTEDSIFLENLEIEEGIPLHISVRLSRMDTDDGEEWYQRPEDPSEMAYHYHENYGIMCNYHPWNPVTKKHWSGSCQLQGADHESPGFAIAERLLVQSVMD